MLEVCRITFKLIACASGLLQEVGMLVHSFTIGAHLQHIACEAACFAL